jgi:DNA-binding NarL/FixJ family response regulator
LNPTRILLLGMSTMLADLVRGIAQADPDVEIVGELAHDSALLTTSAHTAPDVVIVALTDGDLPASCSSLLYSQPRVRVLGLAQRGRDGFVWEMRPHRVPLGEMSPRTLLAAIRGEGGGDPMHAG